MTTLKNNQRYKCVLLNNGKLWIKASDGEIILQTENKNRCYASILFKSQLIKTEDNFTISDITIEDVQLQGTCYATFTAKLSIDSVMAHLTDLYVWLTDFHMADSYNFWDSKLEALSKAVINKDYVNAYIIASYLINYTDDFRQATTRHWMEDDLKAIIELLELFGCWI